MLTIIWAGGQPGKISELRRMSREDWEVLRKDIPTNVKTYIDCDEDTVLISHPDFFEKELAEISDFHGLKFSEGLIPVVTMDENGLVLMQAFSNLESLELSKKESMGIYFSRSRNGLWRKGDTSGHVQKLKRILAPDDKSFIVYEVKQEGAACHEGYYSCFFREQNRSGIKNLVPEIPFLGK